MSEEEKQADTSSLEVEKLSLQSDKPAEVVKIDILLNAVGNSPIMKQRKWTVDYTKNISWVAKFIHKYLKLEAEEKLFLYINQTFSPPPDQVLKNLYECYGQQNKLSLHYSISPAWG